MLNVQWLLADKVLRANADDHTYEDTNKKTSRPSRDYPGIVQALLRLVVARLRWVDGRPL
jgi:hypothetical protein